MKPIRVWIAPPRTARCYYAFQWDGSKQGVEKIRSIFSRYDRDDIYEGDGFIQISAWTAKPMDWVIYEDRINLMVAVLSDSEFGDLVEMVEEESEGEEDGED